MKDEFNKLVSNALDFLKVSAHELDEQGRSKYAVISFFSGLELILKARLLFTDWRLCVVKSDKVTEQEFLAGDFQSIGLGDAHKRLRELEGGRLESSEFQVFEGLRRRRNQAVHFYHPEHLGSNEKIAVEQLVGWNLLYRRMKFAWKDQFEPFSQELTAINDRMVQRVDYFPAVYQRLKGDIARESEERMIGECESCSQLSALSVKEHFPSVHLMHCLVCEAEQPSVFLPCRNSKCGKPAERTIIKPTKCRFCQEKHEADSNESFNFFEEQLPDTKPIAWCGICGYTPEMSVIRNERECFCLACNTLLDTWHLGFCDWCKSEATGSVGDQINPGCIRCFHFIAYEEQHEEAPEFLNERETWVERRKMAGWDLESSRGNFE